MNSTESPSRIVCFSAYADFVYGPGKDRGCDLQVRAAKSVANTLGNSAIYFFPVTLPFGDKSFGEQMAAQFKTENPQIDPHNVIFYPLDHERKVSNTIDETTALQEESRRLKEQDIAISEKYMVAALYHRRRVRIDAKRADPKTRTLQTELLIRSDDPSRSEILDEILIAGLYTHPAYRWKVIYEKLVTFVDQIPNIGPRALIFIDRLTKKQLTLVTSRVARSVGKR